MQGDEEDTATGGEEDTGHLDDEETLSQGTVSSLDISTSDNEDACKAITHEAAHKSDIQYGNWWDEQINQGKEGIASVIRGLMIMLMVENLARLQIKLVPPVPYMEEHGVFKPLDTIANPLGLCRFYHTNPLHSNIITGLKSAAGTHKIKCLLEKVKDLGWLFTIVVFEGSNVTLLGLLQELHS